MKKNTQTIVLLILLTLVIISCRTTDIIPMPPDPENYEPSNFEYLITFFGIILLTGIGIAIYSKNQKRYKKNTNKSKQVIAKKIDTAQEKYAKELLPTEDELILLATPIIEEEIALLKIEDQVDAAVLHLKDRIVELEKRFPEATTIDKIASVNDAILATKLEQIASDLKRIDEKMLGKWEVALITIEILLFVVAIFTLAIELLPYIKS